MDYDLDSDQAALVSGLHTILRHYEDVPLASRRGFCCYLPDMQEALREAGFLDVIRQGLTPLDAALVTIEAARSPCVVETAASGLVWPAIMDNPPSGPVALIERDACKASRFLAVARHALLDTGDDLIVIDIEPKDVTPIESIYAYPYARLAGRDVCRLGPSLGVPARKAARQRWRLGLSLEFAGAAERAVAFTVEYVKQRHAFGRPAPACQVPSNRTGHAPDSTLCRLEGR